MEITGVTVLLLIFQGVSAVCFFFVVTSVKSSKDSFEKFSDSINTLNVNIATLVQTDKNKEERLGEHKDSIARLDREVLKLRERFHDYGNEINGRLGLVDLTIADIKDILKER
tara:strand:- start:1386 stop:1724 length:339 start_codon:yes stop_codon:yes gene_type:complete